MTDILNKIINDKKINLEKYKKKFTIEDLKRNIISYNKFFDFKSKLIENKVSVIAEIKKASPSAGIIIENYNPTLIADQYSKEGAVCISVLTEEKYFFGKLDDILKIKEKVNLPILSKDFFIDSFQVYLAKSFGADAILIILSAVNEKIAKEIYDVAGSLNMSVIVEVHTAEEAKTALNFRNAIIGINNRNLKTLKTDLQITYDLYKILSAHNGPLVCESGIKTEKEVQEIINKTGIKNFLIGESLLKNLNQKPSLLDKINKIKP